MPTYEITIPDKGTFEVNSESDLTDAQVYQYAMQQEDQGPMPWVDVAGQAVESFPSSALGVAEDIATTVMHPIDTIHNLVKVGAGALQNALPEEFVQFVGEDKESRQMVNAMADYYSGRYGSMEGFKQALANDPAAIMADFATVLSGGAGVAAKLGVPANIATKVSKAASYIDPIMLTAKAGKGAGKVLGKVTSETLGKLTGAGAAPIEEAYRAGSAGGEASKMFTEQMRRKAPIDDVLDIAKQDLTQMRITKNAQYQKSMDVLKSDAQILGFDEIDKSLGNALDMVTYKGEIKNKSAFNAVAEIQDIVNKWKDLDPAEFHTPEGMNALKQQVGEIVESLPFENRQARTVAQTAARGVKKQIEVGAPTYTKMMSDYAEAAELVKEIERALSLKQNAAADTSIRKLQSLMRNNASTNYGKRLDLAKELQEQGGGDFMAGLAGQSLSEWSPRGIQGTIAPTVGGLGAYSIGGFPAVAGTALASSPRAIGELSKATGQVAGGLSRGSQGLLGIIPMSTQHALNLAYQAQQPKEDK